MVSSSVTARNLGVTLDDKLSFATNEITRFYKFILYNIRNIHPFFTQELTKKSLKWEFTMGKILPEPAANPTL